MSTAGRDSPTVMLSPFVALRVNSAKHLGPSSQILRCAQDDNPGSQHEGQPREAARSFAALRMTTREATEIDANWTTAYISCRVQGAFSSEHTHLWSYEQQDFRRVIKADDAYMLVTGTGVYES